jgi:hypothetical protein
MQNFKNVAQALLGEFWVRVLLLDIVVVTTVKQSQLPGLARAWSLAIIEDERDCRRQRYTSIHLCSFWRHIFW